jgi:hypothetical protein
VPAAVRRAVRATGLRSIAIRVMRSVKRTTSSAAGLRAAS